MELKEREVDIVFFQETKQKSVNRNFIGSIWWKEDFDYMEVDALDTAGGLLCIWNPSTFQLEMATGSRNMILLKGTIGSFHCVLVNVYGPNSNSGRKLLWENLVRLWPAFQVPWCVCGDFNEVRKPEERNGCLRKDSGMTIFNKFIEDLELIDLPMLGRKFTWSNSQAVERMSRIDRVLVHHEWLEKFKLKLWGLPRTISDMEHMVQDPGLVGYSMGAPFFNY